MNDDVEMTIEVLVPTTTKCAYSLLQTYDDSTNSEKITVRKFKFPANSCTDSTSAVEPALLIYSFLV